MWRYDKKAVVMNRGKETTVTAKEVTSMPGHMRVERFVRIVGSRPEQTHEQVFDSYAEAYAAFRGFVVDAASDDYEHPDARNSRRVMIGDLDGITDETYTGVAR